MPVGNYHRYISEGNYELSFSKSGYQTKIINASVFSNESTVIDVQLSPLNTVGIVEEESFESKIIDSYDVMGRKYMNQNGINLKLYDDGSIKKTINLKQ
jgi:hypothetical protein